MSWRDRRIGFLSELLQPKQPRRFQQPAPKPPKRAKRRPSGGRLTARQKRARVAAMAGRRRNVERLIRERR